MVRLGEAMTKGAISPGYIVQWIQREESQKELNVYTTKLVRAATFDLARKRGSPLCFASKEERKTHSGMFQ